MLSSIGRCCRLASFRNGLCTEMTSLNTCNFLSSRNAHWKTKAAQKKNKTKDSSKTGPARIKTLDESMTWQGLQAGSELDTGKERVVEAVSAEHLIETIVEGLKKTGTIVVIPGKESYAREQLVKTLETILKYGVKPEFIMDATIKNAQLFRCLISHPDIALQIIEILVNHGYVTFEDSIRLLALFPDELVKYGRDGISLNIESISAAGISTPRGIQAAILKCPLLLFARDPKEMQKVAHEMGGFFSRKQTNQLISRCPHLLLKPIEEIEEKYEYVFYQMGAEAEDLSECKAWVDDLTLDDIMYRHKFLVLAGKYTIPDPKRPQIKMENPRLIRVIDSSDEDFATNIARVSLEEWIVFKALQAKIEENEHKERKFERVKPSKRKAYERRHKYGQNLEEHVFDVSANV